jgi:PAS domain S-box-containing protein
MVSSKASDEDALLKAILQESTTEVLFFDADTLRIVQANPSATRNLKYPLKELRKLTPLDLVAPEDRPEFDALIGLLKNGKKRRAALNVCCRRRDGTRYPVEARLFGSIDRGRRVFVCIANDVGQREASRQALEHSASDLRAIVARIPGMAFQVQRTRDGGTELRYVSAQSAQLLGIRAATLRAHPERFFNLILEEDKADYLERLDAAGGGHMSFNWVGRIWVEAWKDVKWVNIRVSRRESPDGPIWDGIMLNVTHSKQAEAENRRSRAQLAALAAHVESVKERERLNIAREVHDDLGGNLTAIKIGLSWLKRHLPSDQPALLQRAAYLDDIADQTIEAARRIAASLRPPVLDFGIASAIDWQLKRFSRNAGIAYELDAPDAAIPLAPDAEIAVFRIVQEALTNVAKHARATRVKVGLTLQPDDGLLVAITDNGRGMQPARGKNGVPGFGLLGMRERAIALGGELDVQSAGRRGTRVSLRIPLSVRAPAAEK